MEKPSSYADSTHFVFIKQAFEGLFFLIKQPFVQDYNVKDLTKIYKGPEVLMNCPSLGLEPWGLGLEIPGGFSGKKSRLAILVTASPNNHHKKSGCSDWELIDFFGIFHDVGG